MSQSESWGCLYNDHSFLIVFPSFFWAVYSGKQTWWWTTLINLFSTVNFTFSYFECNLSDVCFDYCTVIRDLNSSLSRSFKYHTSHARLVNVCLLRAIYRHHITWFVYPQDFQKQLFWFSALRCYLVQNVFLLGGVTKLFNTDTHRHEDGVHTEKWSSALLLKTDNNGRRGGERETHRQRDHPFFFLYRIPFSPLTLLGLTALCRFSIHLSLSAAERHAKHLVPDAVVTWGYSQC